MGEQAIVTSLRPSSSAAGWGARRGPVRVADAVEAFLAVHRAQSAATTARAYAGVLHRVADQIGAERSVHDDTARQQ